jgi:hypothetical protein
MNTSEARRLLKKSGFYIARMIGNKMEVWTNGKDEMRMGTTSSLMSPADALKLKSIAKRAAQRPLIFSRRDATIGQRVRTAVEWFKVPKGTTGTIIEDYESGVMVQWDIQHYGKPILDGFDMDTELHFLEAIS